MMVSGIDRLAGRQLGSVVQVGRGGGLREE